MCVALPGRAEWIGERTTTSIPGRIAETQAAIDLLLVPEAEVGDHVIAHSGYAIAIVSEDAAAESRALLGYDH